ncbi:glycosyltransferase family 2 protein [Anaerocolumna jejuensis]|uniref:glycosyltransferase family 2 protein n=1 Tax=Anaerocolumna jejuensis TaxID=259063 RepID=UPI003F7BBEAF
MEIYDDDLVSIITPMYNAERFVSNAIQSVLMQTYTKWEMIIVDDGSIDQSYKIASEHKNTDNRIHIIRLERNYGISYARNRAISQAKGKYIAFLDSDDIWLPNKLRTQVEIMERSNAAFCFSSCYVIDQNGDNVRKIRKVPDKINYHELLYGNVIPCLTVMINRNKIGIIDFKNIRHEDYAAWLEILKHIDTAALGIQMPLAKYRISKNTVSANKFKSILWVWNIYRKEQQFGIFKSWYYIIASTIKAIKKWC